MNYVFILIVFFSFINFHITENPDAQFRTFYYSFFITRNIFELCFFVVFQKKIQLAVKN